MVGVASLRSRSQEVAGLIDEQEKCVGEGVLYSIARS